MVEVIFFLAKHQKLTSVRILIAYQGIKQLYSQSLSHTIQPASTSSPTSHPPPSLSPFLVV